MKYGFTPTGVGHGDLIWCGCAGQVILATGFPALIAGRDFLRVLDYQDIFCPTCGLLQAQAELFLYRLDKRGARRVVG